MRGKDDFKPSVVYGAEKSGALSIRLYSIIKGSTVLISVSLSIENRSKRSAWSRTIGVVAFVGTNGASNF